MTLRIRAIWILFAIVILTPSLLNAQISPGPLAEAHAHLEGISNCTKCHDIGNKVPDSKCLACHEEIQDLMDAGRGFHASSEVRNGSCTDCHSDHHGRKFDMARFDEDAFDHAKTGYRLEGQHALIDCRSCHAPENIASKEIKERTGTFLGLDQACLSCHDDFHQGTLPKDCASCHDMEAFRPASRFSHDKTEFPLKGKHNLIDCASCHVAETRNGEAFQVFSGLEFSDCVSCHDDPHAGQLPGKCAQCHNENDFGQFSGQGRFDHRQTPFELRGKHARTSCFLCHRNTFEPKSIFQDQKGLEENECASCHDDVHEGKFGGDCVKCHQESSFRDLRSMDFFDHDVTDFPLEGRHQEVDCKSCHEGSFTAPLDFKHCMDCHEDFHEGQFASPLPGKDCAECHTVDGFEETLFGPEQHQRTAFPLEGAHVATPCFSCHMKEEEWVFRGLDTRCVSCHEDIHKEVIDATYYPEQECTLCHSAESWAEVDFDHSRTEWPLEGKHAETSCRSCHFKEVGDVSSQTFAGLDRECQSCHDHHHGNQFEVGGSTDCIRCHSFVTWTASLFDHNLTSFPLDGRHAEVACKECHPLELVDGEEIVKYKLESFKCIDCHY